jgi:hypothetical protein
LRGCLYLRGSIDGGRGKTWQCRIDLLNLFEAFLRKLGSVGKASLRRFVDTIRKKGENVGRTMREFSSINGLATELLVTIISIVKPKAVGLRTTGVPATTAAEAMAARIVRCILAYVLSNAGRQ